MSGWAGACANPTCSSPEYLLCITGLRRLRAQISLYNSDASIGDAARPRRRPRSHDRARRKSSGADETAKMLGGTPFRDNETDDDGALSYPRYYRNKHRDGALRTGLQHDPEHQP